MSSKSSNPDNLNHLAKRYVTLSLAVGQHHADYIDAYYGPESLQPKGEQQPLAELLAQAKSLVNDLTKTSGESAQRRAFLSKQCSALVFFIEREMGGKSTFDQESKALYDAVSPAITFADLDRKLAQLDTVVTGEGDLHERMQTYLSQFVIPKDKLNDVFVAAINEARRRTNKYIALPENESFTIEYVTDKVWSGYNWYKGQSYSLIQMNTDFPITIDRAIDLASHEGYPGHHVFNSLMEKHLVDGKGWLEYSIYPLFSPMSLLAEGSANYGIEVAFPKQERLAFERDVLFPLAGIDPEQVDNFYRIQDFRQTLSYADNLVAKAYLDGEIGKEAAIELLMKYALTSREKSTQRIGFIEANRSYVINYNLGQDIVKAFLEEKVENCATSQQQEKRWHEFAKLLSSPISASEMQRL